MNNYEEEVVRQLGFLAAELARERFEEYAPPDVMAMAGAEMIADAIRKVLEDSK